jgi:chemotaxis protein MotB
MSDHAVVELVIIRHRDGDHGDGHHGGVWKIAYADFMTAMMAFFLVMWLINASNEETKRAVASYFNPIKLADVTSNPKGVQDVHYGASSTDKVDSAAEPKTKQDSTKTKTIGGGAASLVTNETVNPLDAAGAMTTDQQVQSAPSRPAVETEGLTVTPSAAAGGPASGSSCAAGPAAAHTDSAAARLAGASGGAAQAPQTEGKDAENAKQKAIVTIKTALADELVAGAGKVGPGLSVTVTSEGVLISLTDQLDFSMFQVGSAVPNTALTDALKAVGRVLSQQRGPLVIRGHTDARQYHSDTYDNWRLSTDRAHVAFGVLVKSGVEETRFERIEGFADRRLLRADDPLASENRRIEILVRTPGQ